MTTTSRGTTPPFSSVRHALQAIETIATSGSPRAFIVGTARSGKTSLLREITNLLADLETAFTEYRPGTSAASVPPSRVLVVDDLHLLDEEHLDQIGGRALDPTAGLIVTCRPWPRPDGLTAIWRRLEQDAPAVVLGQLSRSDALTYCQVHGRAVSSACLTQILAATGGISWLATRALSLHDDRDCVDDPEHSGLHLLLQDEIAHRLNTADAQLRHLVELVSIDPHANLGSIESVSAVDALIAQGHAEGLLLRNGRPVPVVRSAVLASTPAHRLAELRAETSADRSSLISHDDASAPLLQQALNVWSKGDLDGAAGLVEEAEMAAGSPNSDLAADLAAAIWAERGLPLISSQSYLARPTDDPASSVRALLVHAGAGFPDRFHDRQSVAQSPTTLGVALQLFEAGLRDSVKQQPPASALSSLVQASELYSASKSVGPIAELPAVVAVGVAMGAGELQTAQAVIDAAVSAEQGGPWARPRLLGWQAFVAIRNERPHEAREALRQAEELVSPQSSRTQLLLATIRITLARRYGDTQSLTMAWQAALTASRNVDVSLYSLLPLGSLIDAGARLGDSVTLAPYLAHGLEIVRRLGYPPLWSNHLWWAGVQQGILLNKPGSLAPHAQALVAAAPHSSVAAAMAQAGGVWVAVLGGKVDAGAVEAAARGLAAAGLSWDGARLAAHGAGRLPDDRRASSRLMACARELHPPEVIRHAAGSTESSPTPSHEGASLSEREHDVAVLILQGKTYAEIGQAIFISPRTVEHHVASIRRRLEAKSRSDLIAKLRLTIGGTEDR
ncbi:MAG: LuxR C-terminal-related transcriptional regulator [Propionibacterium sp.]|nr:LuxR C-terminal-related transcriptional regulator [Propionibacterium sp.]